MSEEELTKLRQENESLKSQLAAKSLADTLGCVKHGRLVCNQTFCKSKDGKAAADRRNMKLKNLANLAKKEGVEL